MRRKSLWDFPGPRWLLAGRVRNTVRLVTPVVARRCPRWPERSTSSWRAPPPHSSPSQALCEETTDHIAPVTNHTPIKLKSYLIHIQSQVRFLTGNFKAAFDLAPACVSDERLSAEEEQARDGHADKRIQSG